MHTKVPRDRLYVTAALTTAAKILLTDKQAHYVQHVLRLKNGAGIRLFNSRDGEWLALLEVTSKPYLRCQEQLRAQGEKPLPLGLLFSPLKGDRSEWLIEKATELGVTDFFPITLDFTVVRKVNHERLQARIIEAAEQCERLDIPSLAPLQDLRAAVGTQSWPVLWCDTIHAPLLRDSIVKGAKVLLIGAEGGFSPAEREWLQQQPMVQGVGLGRNILRAETAALAAVAIAQAWE